MTDAQLLFRYSSFGIPIPPRSFVIPPLSPFSHASLPHHPNRATGPQKPAAAQAALGTGDARDRVRRLLGDRDARDRGRGQRPGVQAGARARGNEHHRSQCEAARRSLQLGGQRTHERNAGAALRPAPVGLSAAGEDRPHDPPRPADPRDPEGSPVSQADDRRTDGRVYLGLPRCQSPQALPRSVPDRCR